LNRLGGEFEVDVRDDGTVYSGAVLSENLEPFLTLLGETLSSPKFTAGELAKLKKEVEGEILEVKGNDRALVSYNFSRFFYGDHPYSHPAIGTRKGVKNVTPKDIVRYYVQRFGGKTLQLFGTGAAKKEAIEKWFTALTEKLEALHPEAQPAKDVPPTRIHAERRTLLVDKPNITQSQVLLGGAGMRPETPGFYPILLGNYPFGGQSFEARLMKEVRIKRGWTYGISNSFRYGREKKAREHGEQRPIQLRHSKKTS
jgi:zinc protease